MPMPQDKKRTRRNAHQGLQFHELRHTQVTLFIGNSVDFKTVQHDTVNNYTHFGPAALSASA